MKKVTLILASVAMMLFASCKEETEKTTEKTVVVEKSTEAEAQPVEETDGTSLSVDKDGVEFSSKDGENKTEVEIKEDGGSVSTKK